MVKAIIALSGIALMVATCGAGALECASKPEMVLGEEPYEPGSDKVMETMTVDGIKWSHRYLKSAAIGILRFGVMPDCHRVLMLGRKGLETYAVIDDKEWVHPVFNSLGVAVSHDSSTVALFDSEGTVIVNDVVQEKPKVLHGELVRLSIDEHNHVHVVWKVDGKEVRTIDGVIEEK